MTKPPKRVQCGVTITQEKEGRKMNLEIHSPELVQRVNADIQAARLHDAGELLKKALDALDEQATAAPPPTATGAVVARTG